MNWKQSRHCDNWKKKKVTERGSGHNRQLKLKYLVATLLENEIHIWRMMIQIQSPQTYCNSENFQRWRGQRKADRRKMTVWVFSLKCSGTPESSEPTEGEKTGNV